MTAAQQQTKSRPILFSAPMVQAILAGRKSQTRRIVKPQPPAWFTHPSCAVSDVDYFCEWQDGGSADVAVWPKDGPMCCPYGKPGDTLWVRESLKCTDNGEPWLYAADNNPVMVGAANETAMLVWAHHKKQDHCISIHMPRWASRITLRVTNVRVERLNEISCADVIAEGVEGGGPGKDLVPHRGWKMTYAELWNSIHGPDSWESNPWVWVISFEQVKS